MDSQYVILVMNQKGGTGKTTIADELAFYFERSGMRTAYKDFDKQGGALHVDGVAKDAEIVIIDTAGRLDKDMLKYADGADVVVIPTLASVRDVGVLKRMRSIVDRTSTPIVYVLNRYNGYLLSKDFHDYWQENKGSAALCVLPQAEDFGRAAAVGKSVVDYSPKGKAAEAVEKMCDVIVDIIDKRRESDNG